MFISNEFKAAMAIFREVLHAHREAKRGRTEAMSIKKIQLLSIVNGCFGLFFFLGGIVVAPSINYFLSGGCLFVTLFFWGIAIWLHLATPKGSKENWPPQFKTIRQIHSGFFRLENYPKLRRKGNSKSD